MAKGNRPATSSAEDSLPLGDAPKDMEFVLAPELHVATPEELATEAARLEAERLELDELLRQDEAKLQAEHEAAEAAKARAEEEARLTATSSPFGPRVKVHPHGSIHWDSATYKANEEFQVDTSKHKEADFLELLANGTLLRAE